MPGPDQTQSLFIGVSERPAPVLGQASYPVVLDGTCSHGFFDEGSLPGYERFDLQTGEANRGRGLRASGLVCFVRKEGWSGSDLEAGSS